MNRQLRIFLAAFMAGYWGGRLIRELRAANHDHVCLVVVHPVPLADEAGVWLQAQQPDGG